MYNSGQYGTEQYNESKPGVVPTYSHTEYAKGENLVNTWTPQVDVLSTSSTSNFPT